MENYWSSTVEDTFSKLIDELILTNNEFYLKINNICRDFRVYESVKDTFGIKIIKKYVNTNTVIAKFKYVLYQKKKKVDEYNIFSNYNLSKLYFYVNELHTFIDEYKNIFSKMNVNMESDVYLYSEDPSTQSIQNIVRKLDEFLKLEREKISDILFDCHNHNRIELKRLINKHEKKMIDGEKIMLELRKYIFLKYSCINILDIIRSMNISIN